MHRRTVGARERGAVLIQVALALTVMGGFCAMSIDYGLLMVARGQVQTAADAGALAGAVALGFDDPRDEFSQIELSAKAVAARNLVAQGTADVTNADVTRATCALDGFPLPLPRLMNCVSVSAYRNQARGNALPTFFGRLVGIDDQGVRARATAVVVPSNASDCVWPIAIPDRWMDVSPPVGGVPPTFVKYGVAGPPTLAAPADLYTAPSKTSAGTGFTLPPTFFFVHFNLPLILTDLLDFAQPAALGRFVPVQVPGGGFGNNLASCNSSDDPVTIGDDDRLTVEAAGTRADVLAAAAERIAADPTATWNTALSRMVNSCAGVPPCAPMSPRLVVLPLFDLNRYEDTRWTGGVPGTTPKIRVVNFAGFFIDKIVGTSIEGQLTIAPGRVVMGKPMVGYDWAFLRTPILSR